MTPQKSIALAAAMVCCPICFSFMTNLDQYKCALDEWKTGTRTNQPFSYANYHETYLSILKLMTLVESDPYHAAKFHKMQKEWAKEGMMRADLKESDDQDHLGFKVHLD